MQMPGQEILFKAVIHPPTWYFIYLFLLAGFLAWIRVYYGNLIIQTIQASVNFQVANRMFQDNSLLQNQLDRVLYLFYFLSVGFLMYDLEVRLGMAPYGLHGWGMGSTPQIIAGRQWGMRLTLTMIALTALANIGHALF